ncbi:DNA/RNA non-specific endonuclease [Aliarcobacter butzleri]|uniref:DNA/RNA non-specific endonuclease n=1 Tax=Aliarcobacter butzleri TaxID=28197 RepID=UPI001EDBB26C|nr:DNA/RNA non-specific endonuclease [Aliarcobacter butzleri]MCG3705802.1 DNA/RNA non-specific endonuclease [Aliarcobacter butzleri]
MKKILLSSTVIIGLNATDISNFINLNTCDQIIDKQVFKICYSYKYKGALAVWYELDGNLVNKNNIKNRPDFYSEKNIPIQYRAKSQDYINSGFDRGHLAPDANFDYDLKTQVKTYSMANIVPQYPTLNRKAWIKAEKYERLIASKLKTITVINLIDYSKSTQQIGNNKLSVPNTFYKIIFNDEKNFKKCFKYENIEIDPETDEFKNHQITC